VTDPNRDTRYKVAELLCSGAVSYAEVARQVGVSRERVRQIKHKMHLLPSARAVTHREKSIRLCTCGAAKDIQAKRCRGCYNKSRWQGQWVNCCICGKVMYRSKSVAARCKGGPIYCKDRHYIEETCHICKEQFTRPLRYAGGYRRKGSRPTCPKCCKERLQLRPIWNRGKSARQA